MCFSATASFSSSVVIGALGIYSIKSVTHTHQKYLAAIPFLFGVQQFTEGFVWLTLNNQISIKYQEFFTQSFLSFAWIIWPILVPLALYKFEFGGKFLFSKESSLKQSEWRKLGLFLCLIAGIITAFYSAYQMKYFDPYPSLHDFHIEYDFKIVHQVWPINMYCYIAATVVPFFISKIHEILVLAFVNAIALAIAYYFYINALPSTWCFMSAGISLLIIWIMKKNKLPLNT
jgi:hypothetical protein